MFLDCPTLLNGNAGAQANGMALNNSGTLPAVMTTEHTRNLYVSSLPNDFTTPELFELFSSFGHVVSARFMPPKGGGVGNDGAAGDAAYRGFGFVCYQRGEDAHRAMLSMIGAVVRGSKIQIRPSRRHSDGAHIGPHADGNTSGEDPRRYRSLVPHAGVPLHSNNHHLAQQQYTQQQQFQPLIMLGHSSPPSYATFSCPLAAAFPAPSSFMQQSTNNNSTSSATFLAASPSSALGTQSIAVVGAEQHDGGHRAGGAGGAGGGGGPEPPSSGSDRQTPPSSTVSGPTSFAPSSVKVLGTSASQHTTALGVSAGASQLGISSQSLGLSWQSLNQQHDATNDSGSWGGVARITTPPSTPASSPSWLIATDGGHGLQSAMSASSIAPPSTAPRQQQPNVDASAGQQHQTLHGYYTTAATSLVPQPNHAGHVPQQCSHDVQQQQQQQYFFMPSPMQHQQQYHQQMPAAVHTGGGPPPQPTPPNSGGQFADPGPQTMYYAMPASRGGGGAPQFVMHHGASGIGSQQGNGGGAASYTTTSHPQQLYVLMSPPPSQSLPAR